MIIVLTNSQSIKVKGAMKQRKTYEFVINEIRTYTVQGDGRSRLEAEQEAIERFHRLQKSGELVCDTVSKPRVVREVKRTNYF